MGSKRRLESDFNADVRAVVQAMHPGAMYRRIEDASGNLGTFDTFVAIPDLGCAWIELKRAGLNAKPELRPGQAAFGTDCIRANVATAYLIEHPDRSVRLVRGDTFGYDWRECLIMRSKTINADVIKAIWVKEIKGL